MLKYKDLTFKVERDHVDGTYVGLVAQFPSLSWIADSEDAALEGIKDLSRDILKDLTEENVEK